MYQQKINIHLGRDAGILCGTYSLDFHAPLIEQSFRMNRDPAEDLNVDELRGELNNMKELLAQSLHELDRSKEERKRSCGSPFIDGKFLSTIFLITFFVIITVSIYAFRNLYLAVLKKFPPSQQDEL